MTEQWSAAQIGDSFGAYSGRQVDFTTQGTPVQGTLDYSHRSTVDGFPSDYVHLTVAGEHHVVNADIVVTVS